MDTLQQFHLIYFHLNNGQLYIDDDEESFLYLPISSGTNTSQFVIVPPIDQIVTRLIYSVMRNNGCAGMIRFIGMAI